MASTNPQEATTSHTDQLLRVALRCSAVSVP